jgi:hypothetical protein
MRLWVKILIGFAIGAVVGLIIGPSIAVVKPLGDLFIRLIKMLIVPLVFCSLVVGASGIGDLRKLGRVGGKTIIYFLATTAIAITLAIIFAVIFNPAGGYIFRQAGIYEAKPMPKAAGTFSLNRLPSCGRITVTPVLTGPWPGVSFASPSIRVTWPTFTPLTSVIAFHLPGTNIPISIPMSLARGLELFIALSLSLL